MKQIINVALLFLAAACFGQVSDSAVQTTTSMSTNDLVAVNIGPGHSRRIDLWNFLESLKDLGNWPASGGGSSFITGTITNSFISTNGVVYGDVTIGGNLVVKGTATFTGGSGSSAVGALIVTNTLEVRGGITGKATTITNASGSSVAFMSDVNAASLPATVNATNVTALSNNLAATFIGFPTNSGTDGQVPSLTGNRTKWITPSSGGGGGGGLSNSIPSTSTYTGTNIFCDASSASFFDLTVTNNFILNVTNAATPGFANGESRRIRLRRNGSGQWAGYVTNSTPHFGALITGIDFGSPPGGNVSNAITYLVLVWDSTLSRWDVVGNSSGF